MSNGRDQSRRTRRRPNAESGEDCGNPLAGGARAALFELARGVRSDGDAQRLYDGISATVLRLVFVLLAEGRGLLPTSPGDGTDSLHATFDRLQTLADRRPEALSRTWTAWPQIQGLFRRLAKRYVGDAPARGRLFDLDGDDAGARGDGSSSPSGDAAPAVAPCFSDETVWRVMRCLLLDGDRRLDHAVSPIEWIGAAYEVVLDLGPTTAEGKEPPKGPDASDPRGLDLKPSDRRRRSGSHFTPRSLTESIVRRTLAPVLRRAAGDDEDAPRADAILDLKICDPAMGCGAFLLEACRQLGDALSVAWETHSPRSVPDDVDRERLARRQIAQRCLYGVDRDPLAADLARLSLWLLTSDGSDPFTLLDHGLRHGDSLVGLSRRQILDVRWTDDEKRPAAAGALATPWLRRADSRDMRKAGDAAIACFFTGGGRKGRTQLAGELRELLTEHLSSGTRPADDARLAGIADRLRDLPNPVTPFHWEVELPEVFSRDNGGFDCIVGNPPFMGGNLISGRLGRDYLDLQLSLHPGSHGSADLVAYFFRRSYSLLRARGCMGLIATQTVQQGDTRRTALAPICRQGGTIYRARRHLRWPGGASVIISVVHVCRGEMPPPYRLDGRPCDRISAFLFHRGGDDDPEKLAEHRDVASKGVDLGGLGFLFDDRSPQSASLQLMRDTVRLGAPIAARVKPYLGGADLNESPTVQARRWVIDLNDVDDPGDESLAPLFDIVRRRVLPARRNGRLRDLDWWRYERPRSELRKRIAHLRRVVVTARVSHPGAFCCVPPDQIFNEMVVVFALDRFAAFGILQSRVHEVWARFFSTWLGPTMRYGLTKCFETFAFPPDWREDDELEELSREYHGQRAALMVANGEGLTRTYHRFHDPRDETPRIARLRALHERIDRAVLRRHGWNDLADEASCRFLREDGEEIGGEEIGGEEVGGEAERRVSRRSRAGKSPWRLRWSDAFGCEVLTRLLALNRLRADEDAIVADVAKADEMSKNARIGGP